MRVAPLTPQPEPTPVERDRYAEALGLLMRACMVVRDVIDAEDATTRATAEHAARRWLDAVTDWSREEE